MITGFFEVRRKAYFFVCDVYEVNSEVLMWDDKVIV